MSPSGRFEDAPLSLWSLDQASGLLSPKQSLSLLLRSAVEPPQSPPPHLLSAGRLREVETVRRRISSLAGPF